ncbi:unnamed protein product, partial [Iphiclides podalirius]
MLRRYQHSGAALDVVHNDTLSLRTTGDGCGDVGVRHDVAGARSVPDDRGAAVFTTTTRVTSPKQVSILQYPRTTRVTSPKQVSILQYPRTTRVTSPKQVSILQYPRTTRVTSPKQVSILQYPRTTRITSPKQTFMSRIHRTTRVTSPKQVFVILFLFPKQFIKVHICQSIAEYILKIMKT